MSEKSINIASEIQKKENFKNKNYNNSFRRINIVDLILIIFVVLTFYTIFIKIEYKWDQVDLSLAKKMLGDFFKFSEVPQDQRLKVLKSLVNTLSLSFLSTLNGFIVGILTGLLAARNISNSILSNIFRSIASIIRAVPTIIWVLIFVSGYGLSATTAIVGMFFHTLAFFTRAFAETFEEVDVNTIEALKATGASKISIISGAIIPSSISKIISWFALRFEANFATAVIIGPAVGVAGTIGTFINNAARIADYPLLGYGVIVLSITAIVMEIIMNRIRKKNIDA